MERRRFFGALTAASAGISLKRGRWPKSLEREAGYKPARMHWGGAER
jgi:hypothetical protein